MLTSYEAYLASLPKSAAGNRTQIAGIRNRILAKHPSLAPPEEAKPGLVVASHFWSIFSQEAFQKIGIKKDDRFEQPRWREGKLWFAIGSLRQLCSVDPLTNEMSMTQWPAAPDPKEQGFNLYCGSLEVTPEYAFVVFGCYVWKYHRASAKWSCLDLPRTDYKARMMGSKLGLVYQKTTYGNTTVGRGLLQLDPRDDSYEILISSRRSPPGHALDGKLGYSQMAVMDDSCRRVFFSLDQFISPEPGHKRECQIYEWSPDKKDWITKFSTSRHTQVKDEHPGALIMTMGARDPIEMHSAFEQIVLLNPDTGNLELLLDNPTASQHVLGGAPCWDTPPSLSKVMPGAGRRYVMAWNRGRLWMLACDNEFGDWGGSKFVLYAFLPGQRKAIEVPLRFDVSADDRNLMKGFFAGPTLGPIDTPHLTTECFFATDKGLIVTALKTPGFWFIPYSDIPQIAPFVSSGTAK